MTPNITTSEVLELYGIQRSQLKVWMKEGLRAREGQKFSDYIMKA